MGASKGDRIVSKTKPQQYICDICHERMHDVDEPFQAGTDTDDYHLGKYDLHRVCLEKVIEELHPVKHKEQS